LSGYRVSSPLLARYPPLDALTHWLDRLIEYARVTEVLARGKTAGEVRGRPAGNVSIAQTTSKERGQMRNRPAHVRAERHST